MINDRATLKVFASEDDTHKVIIKAQENIQDCIHVRYSGSTITIAGGEYDKYKTEDKIEIEVYGYTFSTVTASTVRGYIKENTLSNNNVLLDFSTAAYVDAYAVDAKKLEIKASGASIVYVPVTTLEIDELKCSISGASSVSVYAQTSTIENLIANVSGASKFEINSKADKIDANVSGASTVDGVKLETNEVKANLSGASKLAIIVKDKLSVELSGASTLTYYTNNNDLVISKHLSGGSRIIKGDFQEDPPESVE